MVYTWAIVVALLAFLICYCNLPWIAFPVLLFLVFLASGGPSFPRVFFRTFLRDLRVFSIYIRCAVKAKAYESKKYNISDLLKISVQKQPHKTAFRFEGKSWTYQEIDEYTNRIANFFHSRGLAKGDVVALFMENRPEHIFTWLGLGKIGVVTALINFNIRLDSLVHCITVAKAKAVILSSDFADPIADIVDKLDNKIEFYCYGSISNSKVTCTNLDEHLTAASTNPPIIDYEKSFLDVLLYIYTSGTTGLPKPATIRTSKLFLFGIAGALVKINAQDVVYCALPLYHTAGCLMCVSYSLFGGATLVITKKFSASRFWNDCIENKVTVIQYIGELARYLLAQPPRPSDAEHSVRLAVGNGLRAKNWPDFQSRFHIKQIAEIYGATEGNVGIFNVDNIVGSCGFLPKIIPGLMPSKVIRIDSSTGEILRGADGMALDCKPGQPGMIVGRIFKEDKSSFRFDGYVNPNDTANKVARNIFAKDDHAFLTGDIVVQDEYGNVYFRDRTGDTFRWRSENVSTAEVESIISRAVGLRDVVVYGVEVPGAEGKAGMATIADPENVLDVTSLARKFEPLLPKYACPVFLRVAKAVELTGTFKLQKNKLKQEGFDVNLVCDPLYYLSPTSNCYLPIDDIVYSQILNEDIRF